MQQRLPSNNTSGYRGVSKKLKEGYQAFLRMNGTKKHLGFFNTCKQAAVAYDHAVHKHGQRTSWLNFPTMKHNLNKEPKRKKQVLSSTGIRGVTIEPSGRYRAVITINCTTKRLGIFDTVEEAAAAYDQEALQRVNMKTKKNEIFKRIKDRTKKKQKKKKKEKKEKKKEKKDKKKEKKDKMEKKEKKKEKKGRVQGLMELASHAHFRNGMFNRW